MYINLLDADVIYNLIIPIKINSNIILLSRASPPCRQR